MLRFPFVVHLNIGSSFSGVETAGAWSGTSIAT